MNFGWVKLHRKIWENPRSSNSAWFHIFGYLLCHATHKSTQAVFGGQVITLSPGQLVTGRDVISKATKIHRSSVERVLKTLEIEQQIEQQTSTKNRLITIKNWEKYQGEDDGEQQTEQQASNKRATSEHIQECKEGKKEERAPAAARRPRTRTQVTYEPSGNSLLLFKAWKAHFPKDDAPKIQTCKNIENRLKSHSFQELLFSVLKYRSAVTRLAAERPEGVMNYKGSNFFGEKAYYADHLPQQGQLETPQIQERLHVVLQALESKPQPEEA